MPKVHIIKGENGYELIRNGEPFYIKGAGTNFDYLDELKEAGANTARIYDTLHLRKTLDKAEALGLAVVVDIPLPKFVNDPDYYENEKKFIPLKERVERVVRKHKDHPALLYWNLGNELYYPYFYKSTNFFERYSSLVDIIHQIDPNHPVSTTTIGANKLRVLSIHRKTNDLDIISFNIFGELSNFEKKLKPIAPIWSGPHVISEWGSNGPWEVEITNWGAPIEETSTKKAEHIKNRYYDFIQPLKTKNSFGSFVFYWSKKNEVTPTWYSFFGENNLKSQAVFEMSQIWNGTDSIFKGPKLNYILLNEKGALDNIVLLPGTTAEIEVVDPKSLNGPLAYSWEVRHESWSESHKTKLVDSINLKIEKNKVQFSTPEKPGPYRVFVYLTDGSEYFATANIPFYVLNENNGE